jgi:hypothetical protein
MVLPLLQTTSLCLLAVIAAVQQVEQLESSTGD